MQKTELSRSVTILLPVYNDEHNVGNTVKKILELYPDFEVLVVDDGSTDKTMQVAMEAGANVWPHPYNIGNGAAIKTGLRCAKGEWVIMMDANGQHDPSDVEKLLEQKDKYDMVVAARDPGSGTSVCRNIANRIYNIFASYVADFKVYDLTSGFRLVKTSTAKQFIYLLPNTFSYPSTLTLAYLRSGRSIQYVSVKNNQRKGKITFSKECRKFFTIIMTIATLFSPLRIFLPVSMMLFFTGIGYYLFTYLTMSRFTNMSALLFSSSLIIGMIGLVSEQISQMRYDRVDQ
jgi:glycosyltransferase involved in cell wall biosynthesis